MEEATRGRNEIARPRVLGDTRIPLVVRDPLIHPDATPLQEIPKDDTVEVALSKIENLLGKGYYGAALRELDTMKPGDAGLGDLYEFMIQEKTARAYLGIADRYFIRGDAGNARKFYRQAVQVQTASSALKIIVETAGKAFDTLVARRKALIDGLRESLRTGSFDQWCGQKKTLHDLTILDLGEIRQSVFPDFRLEPILGERPPISPAPGYVDPLPPEADFIDFPATVPGSIFKGGNGRALSRTLEGATVTTAPPDRQIPASLAMPVIASVMIARARLFALDQGLSVTGQAAGTVPLFRYEYLRDSAKQTIRHIQGIESRMLPIQFALDDFAELVDVIRRPLAEQKAELEAVQQKINELVQQLAALTQAKKAVDQTIIALQPAIDQCECDWWCWLGAALAAIVVIGIAIGVILAVLAVAPEIGVILAGPIALGFGLALGAIENYITEHGSCAWLEDVNTAMKNAQRGLQRGIDDDQAELTHALATRDILIAKIHALEDELSAVYQSNAARGLDAKTLDLIQAQYNSIRQSLLTRAQAVAALAQDAFNFERDLELNVIREAYFDKDRKDYSAAETLLRDLDGLDYIDITGRTQKTLQLAHAVSLRQHYPASFTTLRLTGGSRFTTSLKDFDRWFPGTYLQRIKEIRVEVLANGEPTPIRGYLSNDGVSIVRFQDFTNKRPVDEVNVFAEPDPDIAKLCYKRLQRRRHVDTMAFPDFTSYLHEDRMRKLQDKERNFFENVGLESSWIIQLLPDQPVDLSKIADVRIHFEYEAQFDENLKRILEQKRYKEQHESSTFLIKRLLAEAGQSVNFAHTVSFEVPVQRLEAPAVKRRIIDVGFIVRPKQAPYLNGTAELEVSYDGAAPVHVVTNNIGLLATAADHPVGTGLTGLGNMARGKTLDKKWTIKITALPGTLSADDIDDICLMLNYEYAT